MKVSDMQIPEEMKRQVAARVSLLDEMMALGGVCSVIEMLETPVMLVMHYSNDDLLALHKRLMKTRRREMTFGLNGRAFLLTRKQAIAVVKEEMAARKLSMANVEVSGLRGFLRRSARLPGWA